MGQVVSLNFGLVHQPPKFEYDFDFDDLEDEIKEQLPEDTAEVLRGGSTLPALAYLLAAHGAQEATAAGRVSLDGEVHLADSVRSWLR